MIKLKVKKMRAGASLPQYQSAGAAGFDLCACIEAPQTLKAGEIAAFPTGISVELPEGYEIQVRSRSGLAFKNYIGLLNGVGTVDADYRGEIQVLLKNYSEKDFIVEPNMRIAQGVVAKVEQIEWIEADELSKTQRAESGFGSTGLK